VTGGIGKALLEVQSEAPAIQKKAINPFFKSKYVSLDSLLAEILPLLNKHGVVLSQLPTHLEGVGPGLRTILLHAESDTRLEDVMPLALEPGANPQSQGSAITYARRYMLMAMLGLIADEDQDGNGARPRQPAKPKEEPILSPAGEVFPDQRPDFVAPAGATDPAFVQASDVLVKARKQMWMEFRKTVAAGANQEDLKTEILAQYGVSSTKELTITELGAVIAGLKLRAAA
jgi:ERF superfamily